MNNLKMYCLSLNPNHLDLIEKIGYVPVGLGSKNFSNSWQNDKLGINISNKNSFYGEYTFHYNLWKNNLLKKEEWIGFCQYRKFWTLNKDDIYYNSFDGFNLNILKNIPSSLNNFETILGEDLYVNQFRFSKFIKRNLKTMLAKPVLFLSSKKRNIKFHFDMWHGKGNLDKAILLLGKEDRNDFNHFVNTNVSFNPHNMFICRNINALLKYYETLFPWLERCEKVFGFDQLEEYGLKRIYGFLAERFMSYWFKKNTKYSLMPILFKDINDFL